MSNTFASKYAVIAVPHAEDEYLMQFKDIHGKVLSTVGVPAGGHTLEKFCVWEGEGLEEGTDNEAEPLHTFPINKQPWFVESVEIKNKYQEAVRCASEVAYRTVGL
jgi:hypothetical protein